MIEEKLMQDFKDAMKSGNTIKKNTVQQLRASILLAKKDNPKITDTDIEDVIVKERSKRLDALIQFEKAGRQDLIEQTNKELACINRYLPKQYTEEELEQELVKIINELQANKSMFGQVMGTAKARLGNRADGKTMSIIVKRLLGA